MSAPEGAKKRRPRSDTRKSPRNFAFTKYQVVLHTKDSLEKDCVPITAFLTDLNNSGLGLIVPAKLECATPVMVILNKGTPLERQLEGEIIWLSALPSSGHILKKNADAESETRYWRVGVKLSHTDAELGALIDKLLKTGP